MTTDKVLESSAPTPPEPTLADVVRDLWRARSWLGMGALIGLAGSVIFLLLAVPQYKATMLVAPTTHAGSPDIAGLFPDNAGSAMEYILQSFGPGDSSDYMRFEAILREPSVAARLLQDSNFRQALAGERRWRILPGPRLDNAARLAAWLQDNLDIEPVGASRLRRISLRHPDPAAATMMLQTLYSTADTLIRSELEDKTAKRIAYLEQALVQTLNPDHRRDITKLLMDQEQIAMILAVHEPYAAALAEPPAAGPRADWPRKSLVVPACVMAGLVLAYAAYGFRRKK